MEIEFIKQELLGLDTGIDQCMNLSGAKFNYALVKTKGKIQKEVEALKAAETPSKDVKTFHEKKAEIARRFAEKDPSDESGFKMQNIIGAGPHPVITDEKGFLKEFSPLLAKYKKDLDAYPKQAADYQDILREKIKKDIYPIAPSEFPDKLAFFQLLGILGMVEDTVVEKETIPVTFNRSALLSFGQVFSSLAPLSHKEFIQAMCQNMRIIYKASVAVMIAKEVVDYQVMYERSRLNLCRAHCKYDIYHNIVFTASNSFVMIDRAAFDKDLATLTKKNQKIVDAYTEFMEEKIDLMLYPIQLSDLPEDATGEQMRVVADFLL